MIYKTDEIMNSLASSLKVLESKPVSDEQWHTAELLPNRFEELSVGAKPVYLESLIIANAADSEVKILKEKKTPHKIVDIIELAHPESVFVADSLNEQGLVENQNEQQASIIQMINKMPTGNVYAAFVIGELSKIATELDDSGHLKQAMLVDDTIKHIHASIAKKAFPLAVIPWAAGAILGTAAGQKLFHMFTSFQEGLVEDTGDLLSNINNSITGWSRDPEYSDSSGDIAELKESASFMNRNARSLLSLMNQAKSNPKSASSDQFKSLQGQFEEALNNSFEIVNNLKSLHPGVTGLDFSITLGLLEDIKKGYDALNDVASRVGASSGTYSSRAKTLPNQEISEDQHPDAEEVESDIPDDVRIKELQAFLNKNFYAGSATKLAETGQLDDETQDALSEVASAISTKLGTNSPVANELKLADAQKLRLLFELYKNPSVHPISGESLFPENDSIV